jgi:peptide deformylase
MTRRAISATALARGESQADGSWIEKPQNGFGALINIAKGQKDIVQAGAPVLRDIADEVETHPLEPTKTVKLDNI